MIHDEVIIEIPIDAGNVKNIEITPDKIPSEYKGIAIAGVQTNTSTTDITQFLTTQAGGAIIGLRNNSTKSVTLKNVHFYILCKKRS